MLALQALLVLGADPGLGANPTSVGSSEDGH